MDNKGVSGGGNSGEQAGAAPIFSAEISGARDDYKEILDSPESIQAQPENSETQEQRDQAAEQQEGPEQDADAEEKTESERQEKLAAAEVAELEDALQGVQVPRNAENLPKKYIQIIEQRLKAYRQDPFMFVEMMKVLRATTLKKMFDRELGKK